MSRVPRLQDEKDSDWIDNGSEDTNRTLFTDGGLDFRKSYPKHGTNACVDESGRIPFTMGDSRYLSDFFWDILNVKWYH